MILAGGRIHVRKVTPRGDKALMTVWRLVARHEDAIEFAELYAKNGFIAVGWGATGDLRLSGIADEEQAKALVRRTHDFSPSSVSNGGLSLWRLYGLMKIGDLVIVTAGGSRRQVMQVTSDYYFVDSSIDGHYEHRRKAVVFPMDPDQLWQISGGAATGEGRYTALIRCAKRVKLRE